jgi:hypothetical protein
MEDKTEVKALLTDMRGVQKMLCVGHSTAWALAKQRQFETVSIGKKKLGVIASIESYVARLRQAAA